MNKKGTIGKKNPGGRGYFNSKAARSLYFVVSALLLLNIGGVRSYGQAVKGVGISEDAQITPDASSILELRSVERGFLAPRMTTAQRTGILSPADGLLVYDTDTQSFWYWDQPDTEWKAISALAWGSSNQLLGMNSSANGVEYKTLIGTNNQVIVTHTPGQIQISTPQDIDINATPEFQNVYVDDLSTNSGVYTDNTGWLTSTPPSTGVIGYWDRDGILQILSPANIGDSITTSGSIYTTGNGSIYTSDNGSIYSATTITSAGDMTSGGLLTSDGGADINGTTTIDGQTTITGNTDINGDTEITGATTVNGDLTISDFTTPGVLHNDASGLVSSSLIVNDDIDDGTIDLTAKVTNILPVANGGTNSGTALNGSSIMISDGTSIVQGEKGTTTTVLHGNASGVPTYGQVVNNDIASDAVTSDKILDDEIVDADINSNAGINTTKLADGSVDNTEFEYLDGVTSSIQNQFTSLQAELDDTQTGAGLDTDGTYVTNSGTNYIDAATSLANADILLDAQIASSAGDISDLQTEVDQVETGAGLDTDGTYMTNSGTNYIDPATSLANADILLDTQIGTNEADIAQEISDRTDADADIQAELDDTQTGAGLDTDGTYVTNSGTNYIDPATSLANADILLDTQIGTNEADIAQEISDRTDADADIQAELDDTQTGAGLGTDGTYVTNSGTNYIDPATSLANADIILDAQIASSAGDISDLQTEVDQIETGAGLDTDGTYIANSGSNYLDLASSLAAADLLLDTQVGTNEADIAQEISDRTDADADIQAELDDTQTGAGLGTDGSYVTNSGTNYIDPATSLANADIILDAQIASSAGDISDLQTEVDQVETGAGLDTDGTYITNSGTNYIDAATSLTNADILLDTQVGINEADIAQEISDRTDADADIQTELDDTQTGAGLDTDGSYVTNSGTNYIDAATSLANADILLDAQIASSAGNISDLQTEVDQVETGAGLDTDGTYVTNSGTNYIDAATSLANADILLDTQVGINEADIAQEISDRTDADADIQAELDDTQTGAGLDTDGTYVTNSGTNYIDPATSLANADILLDAQIASSAGDISDLQTEVDQVETGAGLDTDGTYIANSGSNYLDLASSLAEADLLLDNQVGTNEADIAQEISDRTDADADIQTELDDTQTGAGLDTDGSYVTNSGTNYIDPATSLANADILLDTQVGTNEADIAQEISDRTDADADIQTELDDTQTGAGLDTDGSYVTNSGTNYIDPASSLANADIILDAQIASSAGDISDLQTEVDQIETGAGLDTDGTYIANSGSNYLDLASSLAAADLLLDTQVGTNEDDIAQEISDRADADADIQTELDDTQTGAGLDTDGTYITNSGTNYIDPATSLANADILLDAQIGTNETDIAQEISDRTDADADIQTELDDTQTGAGLDTDGTYIANSGSNYLDLASSLAAADLLLDTQVGTNEADIAQEISDRTDADADIQTELDDTQTGAGLDTDGTYIANSGSNYLDLASSLANADIILDAQIASSAGDISDLQTEVDQVETGAGLDTDGTYVTNTGTNYIDPATSLANADILLDTQIGTNEADIAQEISDRADADADIQTELDDTQTGAGLDTDGTYITNSGTNYIDPATSLANADILLDAQIGTNETDIAQEISDRTDADADIQTELDDTQTGAGLDTDGTYVTNSGTNYIDPATSLANADIILDAQIASSAGDISDLQTEVDQIETGAGLDTDGTYIANSGSNYLDLASSLAAADLLLDTQVGTNEADIAQEISDRTDADADIQTELDDTQTGAGLDTDGSYVTNSGTNYIDAATSLANADILLDTQIASSAGDISDLQTEVDQVETGAGLDTDGTYVTNTGTNYIDPATSLANADILLDTQIGTNEADIAQEISDRADADADIQTELDDTQTGAGLDTDGTYITNSGTNYIDPATSLANADILLDAQIGTNETDIAQEISDRTDADADIQTELDDTQTGAGLDTDGTYITNSGTNYIDPATSLANADIILDAQIASSAGDISDLQTEVDQIETGAGLDTDGTYIANSGSNYLDLASSLAAADLLLDTQVGTNEADIAQEISDRTDADADIQTELDDTQTGAGLDTDGSYVTNSGTNYIDPATSLANADILLDAQIASSAGDISDLQTEVDQVETGAGLDTDGTYIANSGSNYLNLASSLAAADLLLDTQVGTNEADIAQEISDRTDADADIQTELDDTQTGAGLDTDGSYVTNSGTNYIDAATSLANADILLDTQIASSAGDISDLQTEVDQVETGAGLDTDGTYVTNTGTNYIDPATSLANADILLDTQIGTNEADIAQEISDRTDADADIQTELDDTQTGAGLDTDGTYITNSGTNYIDPATSLANADILLDTQIASSAGDISDLQTEVDQVETGAGLDTDGTYVTNTGTNYIDPATSLANADILLDTQIGTNEADIAQEISDRTDADADIQTELDDTQTGAGLDTDGTYMTNSGTNYIDPATSLANADILLDAQIGANETDIAQEISDRTDADADIQTELDDTQTGAGLDTDGSYVTNSGTNYIDPATSLAAADLLLDTQIGTNEADIAQEISDRTDADADIQTELDDTQTGAGLDTDGSYVTNSGTNYIDAATSLANADILLDTQIASSAGDISDLQTEVDQVETGAGLDTDGTYVTNTGTNYIDPATSLANADILLDTQIGTNEADIAQEISDRTDADADIQAELDDTQTGAGLDTDGTYVTNSGTNYIDAATSLANADILLDTQIGTNEADIAQEISDRTDADADIQTELDDTQTGAGLGTDGTYVANSGTNYIDAATSLANADILLDTQIKNNSDAIASKADSDQTFFIGTTEIPINRSSAALALTGITSIDGTASNVTGTVAIANGGTGQTTQQTAINALVNDVVTSGQYLRGNGTNVTMSAIQAGDVPTLNQSTTGNAATATVASNLSGGAAGSVPYQTGSGATAMLPAGTAGQVLAMNSGATAPEWVTPTDGTVTSVSVVDVNGFTGNVATATSTPAITLSTTLSEGSVPFIGVSGAIEEDNTNLYWDDTNNRLSIGAGTNPTATLEVEGDVNVTATGSTTGDPREIGITNWGSGNAARFTFGDPWNALQNAYGDRMQIVAYHGVDISGSRESSSPLGFVTGTGNDASLNVIGTVSDNPILTVTSASGQSANLQAWLNSGGSSLATVNASGVFEMPSVNLSATSDQIVMQSGGVTGTLSWTPTSSDKTITFPDASGEVALKSAGASWAVDGNAGTNPSTNFIGTTDNQDMVFRTNNSETMRIEASTGDMIFGGASVGTVKANTELIMRQDGGTYGSSILRLKNESGENGAIFETDPVSGANLVDFIFKTSDGGSGTVQRNIRFEARATQARTGVPSFEIAGADPDTPTLSLGDDYAAFSKPLYIGDLSTAVGTPYPDPTALLQLDAGTATAETAPLKFTAGTLLSTPEEGAVEYDGTTFYTTSTASSRGVSPSEYFVALSSDYTGLNNSSSQNVFNVPTNGAITLNGSTSYMFEGQYFITCTGNNSVNLGTSFGGDATISSIAYTVISTKDASSNVVYDRTSYVSVASNTQITDTSNDNDYITIIVKGIVRISSTGTLIPQFKFSGAPGANPVIRTNSYFKIYPIGSNTVNSVGNWN